MESGWSQARWLLETLALQIGILAVAIILIAVALSRNS